MLCPKCTTSVKKTDEHCGYCGARVDKLRAAKAQFALLLLLALIIVPIVYILPNEMPSALDEPPPQGQEAAVNGQTAAGSANAARQNPAASPAVPAAPLEVHEIKDDLGAIARAAVSFIAAAPPGSVFLTNHGYLYNYTTASFVYTRDVSQLSLAQSGEVFLFYLRSTDLFGLADLNITLSADLTIYAGYETKAGFVLTAADDTGGTLPREELARLLTLYENSGGEVMPLSPEDLPAINALLDDLYMGPGSYILRFGVRDDKHAVVIASPAGSPAMYNGYVFALTESEGAWQTAYLNYERTTTYKAAINAQIPNLNVNLIPPWRIDAPFAPARGSVSDILAVFEQAALTALDDPVTFTAAAEDFLYIETQSGRAFVGHFVTAWNFTETTGYAHAAGVMQNLDEDAPLFILKYEGTI